MDVAYVLARRHSLMPKTFISPNPQNRVYKPEIWQLVSIITIWYIWKARCLKVFPSVIERPT